MRILGIDPGSNRAGYGLITSAGGVLAAVEYGVLEIPPRTDRHAGLTLLGHRFQELLNRLEPTHLGVEMLFVSRNQKTAMAVAEARGILLYLALERRLPILEYSPKTVKLAVGGHGGADKAGVAKMVKAILRLPAGRYVDDTTDALAVAITAAGAARERL